MKSKYYLIKRTNLELQRFGKFVFIVLHFYCPSAFKILKIDGIIKNNEVFSLVKYK